MVKILKSKCSLKQFVFPNLLVHLWNVFKSQRLKFKKSLIKGSAFSVWKCQVSFVMQLLGDSLVKYLWWASKRWMSLAITAHASWVLTALLINEWMISCLFFSKFIDLLGSFKLELTAVTRCDNAMCLNIKV